MENRCILFARNWSFADFICTTFQESDAPTRSEADSGELGSSNILSSIAAMTSENEVLEQIEQLPGEHCARVQDHRWLTKRLNWQERMILLPHASSKRTNYKINTNQITIKTRMNIMMEMQGLSSFADFSSSSRSFFSTLLTLPFSWLGPGSGSWRQQRVQGAFENSNNQSG